VTFSVCKLLHGELMSCTVRWYVFLFCCPPPTGVRSIMMSVSVFCLSICLLRYLKNYTSKLHKNFPYLLPRAVAQFCSDDNGIHCVLPVLWMTLCFPIMGPLVCSIGTIYVSTVLEQLVINLQHIHQVAPRCLTMLAMMTCGAPAIDWWPAACGIKAEGKVCCPRLPCWTML